MKDHLKRLAKICMQAVLWVFFFSIQWNGRPLFAYANELLVQNALVQAVDEQVGDFCHRLGRAARIAFARSADTAEKKL